VAATLPSGPRQRNRLIFELARRLKDVKPDATHVELRPVLREWHRQALQHIRTKEFSESWTDFAGAWERVQRPAGRSFRATAKAADAGELPAVAEATGATVNALRDRACAVRDRDTRNGSPPTGTDAHPGGQNGKKADGGPPGGERPRLATTPLAAIRPEPVRWLVPGFLPLGKLVLIAGDGGHGKTALTHDLAADVTTGRPSFGLEYDPLPPSDVLLISCEDDFADTVVPRCLAAGADLGKVHRVDGVGGEGAKPTPFTLAEFGALERELEARREVRLVVIDPAGAYIGRTGVDDYKDSDLRALLGPLAELAARRQVTVVLVKHQSKGVTAKAVHRVSGSAGYVNSVRAAFLVAPDPQGGARKLLLPLKFNLGRPPRGLAYTLEGLAPADREAVLAGLDHLGEEDRARLADQLFRVAWHGHVDIDADAALAETARQGRGPGKAERAGEWLENFLGEYAYPSAELMEAGRQAGFTRDNLFAAKKKLDKKVRASNHGRFGNEWHWGLGDPREWTVRPDPDTPDTSPTTDTNDTTDARSVGTDGGVATDGSVVEGRVIPGPRPQGRG
jgi:hypothetical protein